MPRRAMVCPACGRNLASGKESEQCPACGARIQVGEKSCPICGAARQAASPPSRLSPATAAAAALALAAFLGAVWLVKPWADLSVPGRLVEALVPTETPSPTATYTIAWTPTRTPTATATPTSAPSWTPVPPTSTPTVAEPLVYTVAKGDNLGIIARRFGVDEESIAKANGIKVDSILSIGQKLTIPGATGPTPTQETPSVEPRFPYATQPAAGRTPPYATPTASFVYTVPLLLAPANGSVIVGQGTRIVLNWTSTGILGEHEGYLLRIWHSEEDTNPLEVWTQATSWRIPSTLYPEGDASHCFLWQVTVVTRVSDSDPGIAISASSEKREFCWQ